MPDTPDSPRKFYEKINVAINEMVGKLIEDFPELEGAAIALLYAPEIGDPPACLVIGDLQAPETVYRLALQAVKLQNVIGQGITQNIVQLMDRHTNLTKEIDAKRKEEDPPGPGKTPGQDGGIGHSGRPPVASEN